MNLIQDLFSARGLTINIKRSQLSPVQETGAPDINSINGDFSPTGEDPEDLLQSNSSCRKVIGNNSGASCICGNDQCSKAGYPYSFFASLSHRSSEKQGGSSSRAERGETAIPKNGSPHTGSPGRATVVGQDCQDIQFCPTTSRSSNRDRCMHSCQARVSGARKEASGQWRNRRCISML